MHEFTFDNNQMVLMAQFTSELIRQGIIFKSYNNGVNFIITLTGGY